MVVTVKPCIYSMVTKTNNKLCLSFSVCTVFYEGYRKTLYIQKLKEQKFQREKRVYADPVCVQAWFNEGRL